MQRPIICLTAGVLLAAIPAAPGEPTLSPGDAARRALESRSPAGATFEIDPEVGENDFRISTMGPDGDDTFAALRPMVAYNPTANEYLVVWQGNDGLPGERELEIYGQRIDAASGAEVGADDFRISDMGPDGDTAFVAFRPVLAYNPDADEYLVIWYGNDGTPPMAADETEIFGQRLDGQGNEIGANDFRVSDMGPDGDPTFRPKRPSIAYAAATHEYLVVWHSDDDTAPLVPGELEIFGQRIDAQGNEVGANDFRISDMGVDGDTDAEARWPSLAYAPESNEYLVAWNGIDGTPPLAPGEFEIFAQRLDAATGAEVGANDFRVSDMGPDGDESFEAQRPFVTYNSVQREFLVVWQGDDDTPPLVDEEYEVFGQRIDAASGAEVGANDFRVSDVGEDGATDHHAGFPHAIFNPSDDEYLVLWPGDELVSDEYEMYVQRLDGATGAEVGANDVRVSDMGPEGDPAYDAFRPALAYNSSGDEYLLVWSGDDDTGLLVENEREIFGQRFDPDPLGMGIAGLEIRRVSCHNLSTGERASGSAVGPSWTCGGLGVTALVGDRAQLSSSGIADGTGPVSGAVSGLAVVPPVRVVCQNLTTAQTVQFTTVSGVWDCEAEGLLAAIGDRVRQTAAGGL